jgi:polyketide cyclase/dehydrase/lipid transport protein
MRPLSGQGLTRSASVEFVPGAPILLLVAAVVFLLYFFAALSGLLPGGRLDLSRSVLVHADSRRVWEVVRSLPALHEGHGKVRSFGRITGWSLVRGDGDAAGSVWRARGTWGATPYWADVELLRVVPGEELAIRLCRDSLGTHRGLRDHVGLLTLQPIGPDLTKITWRLRARLRSPRLLLARIVACKRLRALLLDQGLRSLKIEVDDAIGTRAPVPADRADIPELQGPPPPVRIPPETRA